MTQIAIIKHSSCNIGDDIQRLILEGLLPKVDIHIDRSNTQAINNLDSDILFIINGWFHNQEHRWNTKAKCCYVGFHINNFVTIPSSTIGCRDLHTLNVCKSYHIPAYLSYCVTLLNKNLNRKRNDILFVDVDIKDYKDIPNEIVEQAIKTTHLIDRNTPLKERNRLAKESLDRLQKAKLVVTSRLHAALPSVAIGVPVIFTKSYYQSYRWFGYEDFIWNLNNIDWNNIQPRVSTEWVKTIMQPFKNNLNKFLQENGYNS
jgi:hypothetical protein